MVDHDPVLLFERTATTAAMAAMVTEEQLRVPTPCSEWDVAAQQEHMKGGTGLRPKDGGTELHLVHRGLPSPIADAPSGGWVNYLNRLATAATGGDPGPDPLADQRVPTARSLGLT